MRMRPSGLGQNLRFGSPRTGPPGCGWFPGPGWRPARRCVLGHSLAVSCKTIVDLAVLQGAWLEAFFVVGIVLLYQCLPTWPGRLCGQNQADGVVFSGLGADLLNVTCLARHFAAATLGWSAPTEAVTAFLGFHFQDQVHAPPAGPGPDEFGRWARCWSTRQAACRLPRSGTRYSRARTMTTATRVDFKKKFLGKVSSKRSKFLWGQIRPWD